MLGNLADGTAESPIGGTDTDELENKVKFQVSINDFVSNRIELTPNATAEAEPMDLVVVLPTEGMSTNGEESDLADFPAFPPVIPGRARIGETPAKGTNEGTSSMSYVNIGIIAFAVLCFVLFAAALRTRRTRFNERALADSDDENSVTGADMELQGSAHQSCVEALAENACNHTEQACIPDYTEVVAEEETATVNSFSAENTSDMAEMGISDPTADLSYNVDDGSVQNGGAGDGDDCSRGLFGRENCSYICSA